MTALLPFLIMGLTQGFVIEEDSARRTWPGRAAISDQPRCFALRGKDTQVQGGRMIDKLDTNDRDRYGWTELHRKASAGADEAVRALLASSADVNALDEDGRTPLHWAAFRGHGAVVKALLEAGAAAGVRDKNGLSADILARARGFHGISETIRNTLVAQARPR